MMTLDQLRIFVAVAEREHMTRAAVALNLTQSAASAAIAALEDRHVVHLFDRIGRRIVLTPTGREFLAEARAVLARADTAVRVLNDLAGATRGTLRLAASQTVGNYWLPPLMQRFREDYPGITLTLTIGNTAQVTAAVANLSADLGFVEGSVDNFALSSSTIPGDRLALVVAPGHPWTQRPPLGREISASPWVLREPGSGTRALFEDVVQRAGVPIGKIVMSLELPSNEAVRAAVTAGAGASLLSVLVVQEALRAGALVEVPFDLPHRAFHVLRHRERTLSKTEQRFLTIPATVQKKTPDLLV
ncbi:LysR family transcriptional regulator [Albidovulum sediminis]|jgi:DNA-binding transcriptional LysR family regulator|nr:LysR family transcriptional regulator [Defluviimonas sediminis]